MYTTALAHIGLEEYKPNLIMPPTVKDSQPILTKI